MRIGRHIPRWIVWGTLALAGVSCHPDALTPGGEEPAPVEEPQTPEPPAPPSRWDDTGATVPAYPAYNPVSTYQDFPRIDIQTASGQAVQSKTQYESGTVSFRDPKKMYSEVTELKNLRMLIRGRGNTTWEGPWGDKNPYRIKLDEHTAVFGMKGDKDWILLSDKLDPSMMRTAAAAIRTGKPGGKGPAGTSICSRIRNSWSA